LAFVSSFFSNENAAFSDEFLNSDDDLNFGCLW
jgi:hypothetical protein